MAANQVIGYIYRDTFIHKLSGTTKLLSFLLISIAGMVSYDTRFLIGLSVVSLALFKFSKIKYRDISFILKFVLVFSTLNLLAVYIFAPEYGVQLYGTRHVIFDGVGRYSLTQEQLFYEFNLLVKYFCTIPVALIFLLTTDPSEFASSLNRIGVSYRISYAVSLAMRYIPDVQDDFRSISQAQQARGVELSKKAKLLDRVKGSLKIAMPLIFTSLDRINEISYAMELRRFGKLKKRTWYATRAATKQDYLALLVIVCVFLIAIALLFSNGGRFYNPFD